MTTATLQEQLFRLPDLGEGLTEAEIVEWKVAVGDTVTIDQIVIEVETAKAAVEVPVPYAGTVLRLHAEAGTALAVGEPLITVGAGVPGEAEGTAGGSGDPSPGGHAAGSASADPAADRYREEEQAGSGNVLIGYGTGHGPAPRRRRRRTGAATGGGTRTEAAQPFGPHAPRVVSPSYGGWHGSTGSISPGWRPPVPQASSCDETWSRPSRGSGKRRRTRRRHRTLLPSRRRRT